MQTKITGSLNTAAKLTPAWKSSASTSLASISASATVGFFCILAAQATPAAVGSCVAPCDDAGRMLSARGSTGQPGSRRPFARSCALPKSWAQRPATGYPRASAAPASRRPGATTSSGESAATAPTTAASVPAVSAYEPIRSRFTSSRAAASSARARSIAPKASRSAAGSKAGSAWRSTWPFAASTVRRPVARR